MRLLRRELAPVGARRVDAADIEHLQFAERQRLDQRAARCQPAALCIARDRRVQRRIVRDHDDAVGGDRGVHLERRHADLQRTLERGQGVFRLVPARAAMALQIECERGRATRDGGEQQHEAAG